MNQSDFQKATLEAFRELRRAIDGLRDDDRRLEAVNRELRNFIVEQINVVYDVLRKHEEEIMQLRDENSALAGCIKSLLDENRS